MDGDTTSPGSLYSKKRCTKVPQGHLPEHASFLQSPTLYSQHLFPTTPSSFPPLHVVGSFLSLLQSERERVAVCGTASRTPAIAHTYLYTVIFKMRERARASGLRFVIYRATARTSAIIDGRGRRHTAEMQENRLCPPPTPLCLSATRAFVFFFAVIVTERFVYPFEGDIVTIFLTRSGIHSARETLLTCVYFTYNTWGSARGHTRRQ